MKQFLTALALFFCYFIAAQTSVRVKYLRTNSIHIGSANPNAPDELTTHEHIELVKWGNKKYMSNSYDKEKFNSKYIFDPDLKIVLSLTNDGYSRTKEAIIGTIEDKEEIVLNKTSGYEPIVLDSAQIQFTGKTKMIGGYKCEKFEVENYFAGKAFGYMYRGVVNNVDLFMEMPETDLGTVMLWETTYYGEMRRITVLEIETPVKDVASYFSLDIPEGYTIKRQEKPKEEVVPVELPGPGSAEE